MPGEWRSDSAFAAFGVMTLQHAGSTVSAQRHARKVGRSANGDTLFDSA
jgi:hypothetical protein